MSGMVERIEPSSPAARPPRPRRADHTLAKTKVNAARARRRAETSCRIPPSVLRLAPARREGALAGTPRGPCRLGGKAMVPDTLIGIFLDTVSNRPRSDQFLRKTPRGWESLSSQRALAD